MGASVVTPKARGLLEAMAAEWVDSTSGGRETVVEMGRAEAIRAVLEIVESGLARFEIDKMDDEGVVCRLVPTAQKLAPTSCLIQ